MGVQIYLEECTIHAENVGSFKTMFIETPGTADSGDWIDMSGEFSKGFMYFYASANTVPILGTAKTIGTAFGIESSTANIVLLGTSDEGRRIIAIGF